MPSIRPLVVPSFVPVPREPGPSHRAMSAKRKPTPVARKSSATIPAPAASFYVSRARRAGNYRLTAR